MATVDHHGAMDMSYDGTQANRSWDPTALVNPSAIASMDLQHTSLVQQPLPQDDLPPA